jgi:hypothetical protein
VTTEEATATVARRVLAHILEYHADEIGERWEEFPLIGEHDWADVQDKARKLIAADAISDDAEFHAAYAFLAARAEAS